MYIDRQTKNIAYVSTDRQTVRQADLHPLLAYESEAQRKKDHVCIDRQTDRQTDLSTVRQTDKSEPASLLGIYTNKPIH